MSKDSMADLLKVIKDDNEDDDKRHWAAYVYGLLMFAEPIDDKTVRITKASHEKLETYIALLRLMKEMPDGK